METSYASAHRFGAGDRWPELRIARRAALEVARHAGWCCAPRHDAAIIARMRVHAPCASVRALRAIALAAPFTVACAASSSATPPQHAAAAAEPRAAPATEPAAATPQGNGEPAATATASNATASNATASNATASSATAPATTAATTPAATPDQRAATARSADPEEQYPPVHEEPQRVAVDARHPDPTRPDPMHGHFTLAQATAGMPPGDELVADIQTSMGTFQCRLLQSEAPLTVANFVGLARGVRDFWDPVAGRWTRRPFYDGSVFHRVIPGFMVQGGDILRSGRGGPGYEIADENVGDHNAAGLLCMANHGANTGGAQFFITEVGLARLNGTYSVFGRCTPTDLVQRIARVPRSPHDQPIAPVTIQHVVVHRAAP
jgi:peptidyl-prolyl cis-trans isomerase A (cyclophilin A)